MRSDVRELARAVPRRGNRLAVADDDRADGNLAAFAGGFGLAECQFHERIPTGAVFHWHPRARPIVAAAAAELPRASLLATSKLA